MSSPPTHPVRVLQQRLHGRITAQHTARANFQACPINAYLLHDLRAAYDVQERSAAVIDRQAVALLEMDAELQDVQAELLLANALLANSERQRAEQTALVDRLITENQRLYRASVDGYIIPRRRLPESFREHLRNVRRRIVEEDSSGSESDVESDEEQHP